MRRDRTKLLRNRESGDETYMLRRAAMAWVYRAKRAADAVGFALPRVTVRVTENATDGTLGVARMSKSIIWITEETARGVSNRLGHVVLHEIGHAVLGLSHNPACPLMRAEVGTDVDVEASLSAFIAACKKKIEENACN